MLTYVYDPTAEPGGYCGDTVCRYRLGNRQRVCGRFVVDAIKAGKGVIVNPEDLSNDYMAEAIRDAMDSPGAHRLAAAIRVLLDGDRGKRPKKFAPDLWLT